MVAQHNERSMDEPILTLIDDERLLHDGDRVLVGVSGGPDSMALLHWLAQKRSDWDLTLAAVHVHHGLRGEAADSDLNYVQHMCRTWNIPFHVRYVDVRSYMNEQRLGKQAAARQLRYDAFQEVAAVENMSTIALAHHADDQLETVLMRLVRGAGSSGLRAMLPKRTIRNMTVIRPLLRVRKEELVAYCTEHNIDARQDASNDDDSSTRNYIRHHIVPKLVALNPELPKRIVETTNILSEEDAYLSDQAKQILSARTLHQDPTTIQIDVRDWQHVPFALQRRVILLLLNYLCPETTRYSIGKKHIDQLLHGLHTTEGYKEWSFPNGIQLNRQYHVLQARKAAGESEFGDYRYELPHSGEHRQEQLSIYICLMETNTFDPRPSPSRAHRSMVAQFDADRLHMPLYVRNRRRGDRLQPLGMTGRQKIKDVFINAKVHRAQRQAWPIIVDSNDTILWVPGVKRSAHAAVSEQTKRILVMNVQYIWEGRA